MVHRLRLHAVIVTSVALVGFAACGVDGSNGTSVFDKPTSTTEPGGAHKVTLVRAGTGPKTRLRLILHKGARTNFEVKVTTDVTQHVSGQTQHVDVSPITENVSLRIVDVKDGIASFHVEITGATLDKDGSLSPEQARSLRSNLRQLVGLTSDGKIDDRGATLSSDMHIPSGSPPALRQTLQQLSDQLSTLSVPLPEEPVGVGATWTTTTTARLSGARVAIRNDYRLTGVNGSLFKLAVTQHQTAKAQSFDLPTLPPGAQARIVAWDITATGTNSLKLGNIFPEAKLHAAGRQSFTITLADHSPQTVEQDLSVDTEINDVGN